MQPAHIRNKKLNSTQCLHRKAVQELVAHVKKCTRIGDAVDISETAFVTSLSFLSNTIFSSDLTDPSSVSVKELKEIVGHILYEAGKPNFADFFLVLKKIDPQGSIHQMKVYYGAGWLGKKLIWFSEHGKKVKSSLDRYWKFAAVWTLLWYSKEDLRESSKLIETRQTETVTMLWWLATSTSSAGSLYSMSERMSSPRICIKLSRITGNCLGSLAAICGCSLIGGAASQTQAIESPAKLLKAQAELDRVIGRGNPIDESDVAQLPYSQAIIKETFRLHPPSPLLPRKSEAESQIRGFTIPKGAQIFVNVWVMGRDAALWEDPNVFSPERFLGSEMELVKGQSFELIPFGGGRRICPGLPLALRMLDMMLGTLLNCFNWKLEGGIAPEDMNMDDKYGATIQKDQPLRAVPTLV
ncbi:hypothetical protein NL676_011375 [Syzygium grande]|nr:hypothetical protein NL676_011375 [Syzygium grande]